MKTDSAPPAPSPSTFDLRAFWNLADDLQRQTVDHAGALFAFVETASPPRLFSLLAQYRCFTDYYIADIALLIARLPPGRMRSFLADILFDELGSGDAAQAHPQLYDDFLSSLGIGHDARERMPLADNLALLDAARARLVAPGASPAYGVGLRGMGGECVCQVYLAKLYEHLIRNPYVRERSDRIDWTFWELHVGEHDIAHREKLRALIGEEIGGMDAGGVAELERGYRESMAAWQAFWSHIHAAATAADTASVARGAAQDAEAAEPAIAQFHLAIGVHDLQLARAFYCDVLGAGQGRSTKNLIDLDFYGHHLVIHQAPQDAAGDAAFGSAFYGETVKVPHFGMNLNWRDWSALAERIKRHGYGFIDPPHVRMRDLPGEHATMFLSDPSGNALEFKAFRNHAEVFATIFAAQTQAIGGLDGLVEKAAAA